MALMQSLFWVKAIPEKKVSEVMDVLRGLLIDNNNKKSEK